MLTLGANIHQEQCIPLEEAFHACYENACSKRLTPPPPPPVSTRPLRQFFFLNNEPDEKAEGGEGEQSGGMAMLMRAMEREEHDVGELLIEQARDLKYVLNNVLVACRGFMST